MVKRIMTNDFSNEIYKLLEPYSKKSMNLMISGGSLLSVLNYPKYLQLDSSKWRVYFADERCNIDHLNFKDSIPFLNFLTGQYYPIIAPHQAKSIHAQMAPINYVDRIHMNSAYHDEMSSEDIIISRSSETNNSSSDCCGGLEGLNLNCRCPRSMTRSSYMLKD